MHAKKGKGSGLRGPGWSITWEFPWQQFESCLSYWVKESQVERNGESSDREGSLGNGGFLRGNPSSLPQPKIWVWQENEKIQGRFLEALRGVTYAPDSDGATKNVAELQPKRDCACLSKQHRSLQKAALTRTWCKNRWFPQDLKRHREHQTWWVSERWMRMTQQQSTLVTTDSLQTPAWKMAVSRTPLEVQWLRLWASNAGAVGSISGRRTKIPHAMWCG